MSLTDRLFSPSSNIPPQEGGTGSATGKKVSYFLNSLALCLLFCGGARALPQDWRCEAIEVAEVSRAADVGGFVRIQYVGEKDGVRMKVEFFADEENPDRADLECGN